MEFNEPFQLILFARRLFELSDESSENRDLISIPDTGRNPPFVKVSQLPRRPDQPILLDLPDHHASLIPMGTPISQVQLKVEPGPDGSRLNAVTLISRRKHWRYTPRPGSGPAALVTLFDATGRVIGSIGMRVKNMSFYGLLITPPGNTDLSASDLGSADAVEITIEEDIIRWPLSGAFPDPQARGIVLTLKQISTSSPAWRALQADWQRWVEFLLVENFKQIRTDDPGMVFETLEERFTSLPGQHADLQRSKQDRWIDVAEGLPWHVAFNAIWFHQDSSGLDRGVVTITFARLYAETAIGFQFGRSASPPPDNRPLAHIQYAPIRDLYFYCFSRLQADPDLQWVAGACRSKHFLSVQFDFAAGLPHDRACVLPLRLIEINFFKDAPVKVDNLDQGLTVHEITPQDRESCRTLLKQLVLQRPLSYIFAYDFAVPGEDGEPELNLDRLFLKHTRDRVRLNTQADDAKIETHRRVVLVARGTEPILYGIMDSTTNGLSITGVLDQLRIVPLAGSCVSDVWAGIRSLIDDAVAFYKNRGNSSWVVNLEGDLAGPPNWSKLGLSRTVGNDYGPGFTFVLSKSEIANFLTYLENWAGAHARPPVVASSGTASPPANSMR